MIIKGTGFLINARQGPDDITAVVTLSLLPIENRPLSLGSHVESQKNKKLFFFAWQASHCKSNNYSCFLLILNMATCDKGLFTGISQGWG